MRHFWGVLVALSIALPTLSPAVARADDREVAREHFIKGSKDFDLGLYDDAIKEYMAAYEAKADPALLYNIAQAHRLAGHSPEALRFYKMFLTKVPAAQNSDEVRAKIAELEKLIAQQKKAQTMPPDQVKPLGSTPEPTAAPPSPTPTPPLVPPGPSIPPGPVDLHAGRTKKIAGLAVAGIGVAALVTGIALSAVAKSDSDALTKLDQSGGVWDPSKDSAGRTFGLVGPVLIGVGAAAVAAGGVVAILGSHDAKRARERLFSFVPSLSPRSAGATVRLRF